MTFSVSPDPSHFRWHRKVSLNVETRSEVICVQSLSKFPQQHKGKRKSARQGSETLYWICKWVKIQICKGKYAKKIFTPYDRVGQFHHHVTLWIYRVPTSASTVSGRFCSNYAIWTSLTPAFCLDPANGRNLLEGWGKWVRSGCLVPWIIPRSVTGKQGSRSLFSAPSLLEAFSYLSGWHRPGFPCPSVEARMLEFSANVSHSYVFLSVPFSLP